MAQKLKHQWSISHNYMAGVTFGVWLKALAENKFQISPAYAHRAAFITLACLSNSVAALADSLIYGKAIRNVELNSPPVFILGHWRSGTTLLHDLLAQDTQRFNFANTYQVVNPLTFLTTENLMTRALPWLLPPKRPMDNMKLKFESPQEDEFAPLLMTLKSVYLGISFPNNEEHYEQFLSFRDAARSDVEAWQNAMLQFCQKLSLNNQRSLLLKSPPHTARIRTILEIFPDARFVHIHRNPYRVFLSQRHFFDTAGWYTYLQRPHLKDLDERILARYKNMFDAYFEDLALIPEGRFCDVKFDDLERNPVAEIEKIYQALSFDNFGSFKPNLQAYVDTLSGYQKNDFNDLDEATRAKVYRNWKRNFERWNYPEIPDV